jgi:acetoin utilization deacetylase AcuC-like enzyme
VNWRARELQPERDRDGVRQGRLADAGNVLDQEVAAGEEAGDAVLDLGPLADDDRANLVDEFGQLGGKRSAHRPDITRKTSRSKTDDHGVLHTSRLPRPRHGPGHPECPARLDAIDDHLIASGLQAALDCREAPMVESTDLGYAHSSGYVAELRDVLERVVADGQLRALDPDTVASPGTLNAVLRAAGAAVAATDAVIDGEVANAFCAVRPPGHHATRDQAMGFCFFNNVAVAARHALDVRGLERVAIIDFDVHHGNGTEDICAGDERVLMASIFQHPALSVQRRRAARRQHDQRAGAAVHARPAVRAPDRGELDEPARQLRAADDLRLGRLRRAPRRRARPARPGRGPTTPGSPRRSRRSPTSTPAAASSRVLEGGYNLGALARSVAPLCAS